MKKIYYPRVIHTYIAALALLLSSSSQEARGVLLFTFDDSGSNVTATVTGSFDSSTLSTTQDLSPLSAPGFFSAAVGNFLAFSTIPANPGNAFSGADFTGLNSLLGFDFVDITNPLSGYIEFLDNRDGSGLIFLAAGQTVFDADSLADNVAVFDAASFSDIDIAFDSLSPTPTTVIAIPNGGDVIQFAGIPEPSISLLSILTLITVILQRRRC